MLDNHAQELNNFDNRHVVLWKNIEKNMEDAVKNEEVGRKNG